MYSRVDLVIVVIIIVYLCARSCSSYKYMSMKHIYVCMYVLLFALLCCTFCLLEYFNFLVFVSLFAICELFFLSQL